LILELARHADVFMENLAPGSLAKMGLGYSALAAANPDIVYCSVSGFGARSAYGDKRALDTVVQAACGLMHMTGYPDHHPVKLGISAIDLTTATATMAAVLAGLRERQANGRGGDVDLAMADIGVWMTQRAWPELLIEGRHPVRQGNRRPDACPHNTFPAKDGRSVAIAVETDAQWRALVGLIGPGRLASAELASLSGRLDERDAIETAVGAWVIRNDADQIASLCQEAGVPAAVVRDLVELCADPETRRRRMIVEIDHPSAGPLRLLGNPMALSRTPAVIAPDGAPQLGQNTWEILSDWLNLAAGQIAELEAAGLIVDRASPTTPVQEPALTMAQAGR
jgi:crotonobetainyl-CoA:carnitine CoA-transferase CaiB-like acyl-CoA transferase